MAISGISNYRDALYQWQGQQLKNTGSGAGTSGALGSLFGSNTSMIGQISSMVELTKYAMDKMGLSSDSRVTFSQISKYREQLQSEFSQSVKKGFGESGISDISALTFTLSKDGKISVKGENASDTKKAQAWLDANPDMGKDMLKTLEADGVTLADSFDFRLSTTGKMTVIDNVAGSIQNALDAEPALTDDLRKALDALGYPASTSLEFVFDDDGSLVARGEGMESVNSWLAENPALSDTVKKQLEKNRLDTSAATLRLGQDGNVQISVNNAENNDIQKSLDKLAGIGGKIKAGLDDLAIDPNVNFTMQVNDDGSVTIVSDHPDRDKVQRFFDENPELIKTYRQIETLAGIDDARKAMQISRSAMRKRIQIESMSAWWATSGNADSYFGTYDNGSLSLMAGLNLNI